MFPIHHMSQTGIKFNADGLKTCITPRPSVVLTRHIIGTTSRKRKISRSRLSVSGNPIIFLKRYFPTITCKQLTKAITAEKITLCAISSILVNTIKLIINAPTKIPGKTYMAGYVRKKANAIPAGKNTNAEKCSNTAN